MTRPRRVQNDSVQSPLETYLREINETSLLSAEEEKELANRIGETFRAIVTGVNEHGTFVRTLAPHVDGMLVQGQGGFDVGDSLNVKLVRTDPARGFIDFAAAG